jgi:hypothetical protein
MRTEIIDPLNTPLLAAKIVIVIDGDKDFLQCRIQIAEVGRQRRLEWTEIGKDYFLMMSIKSNELAGTQSVISKLRKSR